MDDRPRPAGPSHQAGGARSGYERKVFIQCWPSAAAGAGVAPGGGAATMGPVWRAGMQRGRVHTRR